MPRFRLLILVIGFTLCVNKGDSQEDSLKDIFDLSIQELMDVEITSSSRFSQHILKAPNVVKVINREDLNNYSWKSINDVMYRQSGFFPSQDYDRMTIGSRGITEGWNNNHLLLTIDGIPFNLGSYGATITSEYTPLIFSKSIEIIKGPGSAVYGTNAAYGVVTLNTVSASNYRKDKFIYRTRFGERNTIYNDVLLTFKTERLNICTSFSIFSTAGEKYLSYDGSLEMDTLTGQLKKFYPSNERYSGYYFLKLEGVKKLKGLSLQYHAQLYNTKTGHGWLWNIPDKEENIRDYNNSVVLKYQKSVLRKVSAEFAIKYSIQNIDWDMWYYRSGSFEGWYPDGVNEYLKTSFETLYGRAQFNIRLPRKSTLVLAVEPNLFYYDGDKVHYANADLNNSQDGFPALGKNVNLGPYLELIENKFVKNAGSFAQFSTGELLGEKLEVTAGIRYDIEFFKYKDLTPAIPVIRDKKFDEFTPRIAFVFNPIEKLTLKLMAGKAFRAPSPTELFGYNTWAIASNIDELKSERIKNIEFALNYRLWEHFNLSINSFYTEVEGIIGYSIGNNNLSTNLYDLTNTGMESELLFKYPKTSGFLNAAYTKRISEKIFESELPFISEHQDRLTWAPAWTINAGYTRYIGDFQLSLVSHYQGKVLRRNKDYFTNEELQALNLSQQPRPQEVNDWISFDAKIAYRYNHIEFGVYCSNLLDSENYLVKNLKYPFDYKMDGRRISLILNVEF